MKKKDSRSRSSFNKFFKEIAMIFQAREVSRGKYLPSSGFREIQNGKSFIVQCKEISPVLIDMPNAEQILRDFGLRRCVNEHRNDFSITTLYFNMHRFSRVVGKTGT